LPVQCEKAKASYSEVNKNSGILWSEATFKEYLIDPSAKIPAYLKQFGSDGKKK
jgi:cytochrome c